MGTSIFTKTQKGCKALAILAPMAPVLFLYDLDDTEGGSVDTAHLKPSVSAGRLLNEALEKTVENCAVHGIAVGYGEASDPRVGQAITLTYNTRQQYRDLNPDSQASYLIVLDKTANPENRYQILVHGLGHIFCGHLGIDGKAWWQDRRGIEQAKADIEADSVAFLTLRRKGLTRFSDHLLSGYRKDDSELPAFSLNAVFHAAQYTEDMGKSLWQFPKRKSRYL